MAGRLSPEEREALYREVMRLRGEGMSQPAIAERVGRSQTAIHKIERRKEAGRDVADDFCRAFGVTMDELVEKHGTRPEPTMQTPPLPASLFVGKLRQYRDLMDTAERGLGRWDASDLVALVADLAKNPALTTTSGVLVRGTWEDLLDEKASARAPRRVGGVDAFRAQHGRQHPPTKGGQR